MPQSEFLRLQRIDVRDLFGLYNHRIDLNLDARVTLLHGPNGVGKTAILRMVNSLLKGRLEHLRRIPFSRFLLEFNDGSTLTLVASRTAQDKDREYKATLKRRDGTQSGSVNLRPSRAASVASRIEYLRPHETRIETWVDIRDGEVVSASEILDRFDVPVQKRLFRDRDKMNWFSAFLETANVHFIEAQRLVRMDPEPERGPRYRRRWDRPRTTTVVESGRDLTRRLADTMAHYGRQSQTLDQSFPQRLISATDRLAEPELQERMSSLDQRTADLKEIGILDETPTHPFPLENLRDLDDTEARVMTLYILDTEKKLRALDDLSLKAQLLLDSVNKKFRHKRIRLDRENGLVAESDTGQKLSLESLSSGEQHELVLNYDLLFRVPSNTVVLIDEPELSLHVAWQKEFLQDLLRIIELSNFDALVATHSPYIVGVREELMVGLGDAE